jgi:hypothetical protein
MDQRNEGGGRYSGMVTAVFMRGSDIITLKQWWLQNVRQASAGIGQAGSLVT